MVILIIYVADLMLVGVDSEGQAPVACDVKTPCAFAITGHLMRFPDRDRNAVPRRLPCPEGTPASYGADPPNRPKHLSGYLRDTGVSVPCGQSSVSSRVKCSLTHDARQSGRLSAHLCPGWSEVILPLNPISCSPRLMASCSIVLEERQGIVGGRHDGAEYWTLSPCCDEGL